MSQVCPLIFRNVDETVARLNAFSVSALYVLFLVTDVVALLYFIVVDFLLRLYTDKRYSPMQQLSLLIQKRFDLGSTMVDAGAKRVAAYFGLAFMIASIVLFHLYLPLALHIVAAIFLVCSSLELAFAYCLGCQVYYLYRKLFGSGL